VLDFVQPPDVRVGHPPSASPNEICPWDESPTDFFVGLVRMDRGDRIASRLLGLLKKFRCPTACCGIPCRGRPNPPYRSARNPLLAESEHREGIPDAAQGFFNKPYCVAGGCPEVVPEASILNKLQALVIPAQQTSIPAFPG
jgi:hypothetical protein